MIPFAAYTAAEILSAFQWTGQPPKLPLPVGDLDPIYYINTQNIKLTYFTYLLIHDSFGRRESAPKPHLDRFSRFCRAHERD